MNRSINNPVTYARNSLEEAFWPLVQPSPAAWPAYRLQVESERLRNQEKARPAGLYSRDAPPGAGAPPTAARTSAPADAEGPAAKIVEVDASAADARAADTVVMRCALPPHREALAFPSYGAYETHYHQAHSNRCVECRRNFPSNHLLHVHIEECHDAFAAVRREKGEHTYSCFVEDCDRKCRTPQKRRMHLIDKHMYPPNYFFAVTKEGIDGRSSLLLEAGHRRRRSSLGGQSGGAKAASRRHEARLGNAAEMDAAPAPEKAPDRETAPDPAVSVPAGPAQKATPTPTGPKEPNPDTEMEDLAGAMSSLRFIPNSVRFGRGKGKSGFARR